MLHSFMWWTLQVLFFFHLFTVGVIVYRKRRPGAGWSIIYITALCLLVGASWVTG